MARTRAEIQATMDAEQATQTSLSTLDSTSQTAIYTLWKYITSSVINYFEQLWDLYKVDLENIVSNAAVGTNQWFKDRVLKFQYSASTPQVLEVDSNYAINYQTIDESLRIITRASVKTTATRTVLIKVAKQEPPVALSGTELTSLTGYIDDIAFAGINYVVSSTASDKLYLKANIYFDGQYSATIQTSVIAAINTYLANLTFDGSLVLSSLFDAIQGVTGVIDCVFVDVAARADATAFASKTYLVQTNTTLIRNYPTNAGYIVEETTASNTFTDTLTFIPQ